MVSITIPVMMLQTQKYRAILYFQDESNVSLTAFLGKTWALRGKTPKTPVTGKRGGVAALSAISKPGHLLFRLLEKRIASGEVIEFLAQNPETSSSSPPCDRHRSGTTSRLQKDQSLHRESNALACVLSSQILPRLEPRRKSLEPSETSRTEKPSSENERRTQTLDSSQTTIHGEVSQTPPWIVLSLLCVRFIRMSHNC